MEACVAHRTDPRCPATATRAALVALLLASGGAACSDPDPDVIFFGANVITMAEDTARAEALAVRRDEIIAVGTTAELDALAGPATQRVDLGGRTVVPGFIDAHSHLDLAGQMGFTLADLRPPPIGTFSDVPSIQRALRRQLKSAGPDEWIVGSGYDDTLLREKRHLTRTDLDAVSATRPIVALHVSLHIAVANSTALALAGIDASTPQPTGGVIRKDPDTGQPTGVLEEAAMARVLSRMPPRPRAVRTEALGRGIGKYARQGITTAQDGATDLETIEVLMELDRRGRLPVRVVMFPRAEIALRMMAGDFVLDVTASDRLTLGAVKIIGDGSIQGYTGYLREPYHVPPADDPAYRGFPAMPPAVLTGLVRDLYDGGFQVAIHANGDAAIDDALHAIEVAQAAFPRADDRPILIHAQMSRPDQLDRMAALGAVPSFFVLHTYYWGNRHRDVFMGPERAARMSPLHSARDRGLRFTIHTDAPVVPMEPLRLLWSAVNRVSTTGDVIGPDERIGPEAALRAMTLDAAYAYFKEDAIGSLEPGKKADFVVLSADPTTVDPMTIDQIQVLRTVVGGETVFAR